MSMLGVTMSTDANACLYPLASYFGRCYLVILFRVRQSLFPRSATHQQAGEESMRSVDTRITRILDGHFYLRPVVPFRDWLVADGSQDYPGKG